MFRLFFWGKRKYLFCCEDCCSEEQELNGGETIFHTVGKRARILQVSFCLTLVYDECLSFSGSKSRVNARYKALYIEFKWGYRCYQSRARLKRIKGTLWKHFRTQWGKKSCWISIQLWTGHGVRNEGIPHHLMEMKLINLQMAQSKTLKVKG